MKKRYKVLPLLMIIVLLGTVLPTTHVEAGARTFTVTGSTFKSSAEWNNLKNQATVDGEKLIFPADSTEKTGFICKSVIRADEYFETLASVEMNLKLTQLPAEKSFVLAFGLAGIESGLGNKGNVEVTFTNNKGIKVGVVAYETTGTPVTVCNAKTAGMSLGTDAKVKAEVTNAGEVLVSINGKRVCSGTLPVTGQGRVGFLQTGNCAAEVTNFKLTAYQYYRPENTNISEDFSEGSLNISVLMGRSIKGNKTFAFEKYNDNPVLMFRSVKETFLGTQDQYSNFEMTFDVPYITTKSGVDANGEGYDGTGTFGISFGSEKLNAATKGYESAIDMITFKDDTVYSYKNKDQYTALNPCWDGDKPFSVQVIVKDCTVTVGTKWMNEKNYQTILNYEVTNRDVSGYVHFWIVDQGNLAMDNLKITNLDHNGAVVEKEFVSGLIEKPEDWVYEPFERVYASETENAQEAQEETGIIFSWYLLIPTTALAGILVLVVADTVVRTCKKRKMKKEVIAHEE